MGYCNDGAGFLIPGGVTLNFDVEDVDLQAAQSSMCTHILFLTFVSLTFMELAEVIDSQDECHVHPINLTCSSKN